MSHSNDNIAVLLIAHGSRVEGANDELRDLAERLRAHGQFAIVEPTFLELAAPDIAQGAARCVECGARRVLMIPYFLSLGMHLTHDLANARDALAEQYPEVEFRLAPPLGPHPLLDELVRERIRDVTRSAIDTSSRQG
jgi:sirohydrochlorin ferrochelatase